MLLFTFGKKAFHDDVSRPNGPVMRLIIQATNNALHEFRLDLAPCFRVLTPAVRSLKPWTPGLRVKYGLEIEP